MLTWISLLRDFPVFSLTIQNHIQILSLLILDFLKTFKFVLETSLSALHFVQFLLDAYFFKLNFFDFLGFFQDLFGHEVDVLFETLYIDIFFAHHYFKIVSGLVSNMKLRNRIFLGFLFI